MFLFAKEGYRLMPVMYGSDETDLKVRYYDLTFGVSGEAEINWYLKKARAFGGPVLDLACGTGRLALSLAQKGFDVTGIDSSVGMLNQFELKLKGVPTATHQRVHIANQDMTSFSLKKRFNTILCCDAFFHNLTIEEEINCLDCVARHLAPGGRFIFNLPNPTFDFILKAAQQKKGDFEERGRYALPESGTLRVEQAHAGNILDQTITTTLRLIHYGVDGNELERGESTWVSRYLFRYEAVHLLYRCGFEVEALIGDYSGGPVTAQGQLIFQTRLKE
jgi:SAM-dependent methyltransferase